MTIRAVSAPDHRAPDHPSPADAVRRTEQVLEVLRDLRDRDADAGGSASPEIDEAIREFSRAARRLRARGTESAAGIACGDDDRPV